MDWDNFAKLRGLISTLKPSQFDYWKGVLDADLCGCVAAHGMKAFSPKWLTGDKDVDTDRGLTWLAEFLGIEREEGTFIWVACQVQGTPDDLSSRGWLGIREALRRLDVVASHYTRPTISVAPSETKAADRERAFLQSCMAVAAAPVEETAE